MTLLENLLESRRRSAANLLAAIQAIEAQLADHSPAVRNIIENDLKTRYTRLRHIQNDINHLEADIRGGRDTTPRVDIGGSKTDT